MNQLNFLSTILSIFSLLLIVPANANIPENCSEDFVATELIMVCDIYDSPPDPSYSNPCNETPITIRNGLNCNSTMLIKIFVANLFGFNQEPPINANASYSLPAGMPDIYVEYDSNLDGTYDMQTRLIRDFYFKGMVIQGTQGSHYIFERELVLSHNIDNYCQINSGQYTSKNIMVRLLQKNGGQFELYDLKPYSGVSDVFSCEIFHETNLCCLPNNSSTCEPLPTEYFALSCVDCDTPCELGGTNRLSNPATRQKSILQEISPNPFENQVEVVYLTDEEVSGFIEVIDVRGNLIQHHSLAKSKGEQSVTLELSSLPAGVYYCKLRIGDNVETKKILKLKN